MAAHKTVSKASSHKTVTHKSTKASAPKRVAHASVVKTATTVHHRHIHFKTGSHAKQVAWYTQ